MGQTLSKNTIETGGDKKNIVQSIKRSLNRGSSNDQAYSDYVKETQDFAYIQVQGTIIAFISLEVRHSRYMEGDFIEYLWVHKNYRRKGYAKRLFDFYKNKHATFSLFVTSASRPFWEKMKAMNTRTHTVTWTSERTGDKMIWTRKLHL